jgi:hypothetical protein
LIRGSVAQKLDIEKNTFGEKDRKVSIEMMRK